MAGPRVGAKNRAFASFFVIRMVSYMSSCMCTYTKQKQLPATWESQQQEEVPCTVVVDWKVWNQGFIQGTSVPCYCPLIHPKTHIHTSLENHILIDYQLPVNTGQEVCTPKTLLKCDLNLIKKDSIPFSQSSKPEEVKVAGGEKWRRRLDHILTSQFISFNTGWGLGEARK